MYIKALYKTRESQQKTDKANFIIRDEEAWGSNPHTPTNKIDETIDAPVSAIFVFWYGIGKNCGTLTHKKAGIVPKTNDSNSDFGYKIEKTMVL